MSAHPFLDFATTQDRLPRNLFGYEVLDFIGQGAGSSIYLVSDPASHQIYALKHVTRKEEKDIRFIEQLENEYAVSRAFPQCGLRRIFDLKVNRTMLRRVTEAALVMELFDGTPLDSRPLQGILGLIDVFVAASQALQELHQLGLVHCDLKPNNILVGPTGEVRVIDFGQTCRSGTIKERIQGTPDYISPEQVKCEPVNVRTDVFSFGATMYWALCGQKIPTLYTLKRSENSFLIDQKMVSPRDINARVPENLSNLVMDCVRNNPAKRPESMSEVARRLELIKHILNRPAPMPVAVGN